MKQEKLQNLSIRLQNKIYKQWSWLFKKDSEYIKLSNILYREINKLEEQDERNII